MADALTTSYSFIKIEVGASDNTWGGKTNTNWDLLDANLEAMDFRTASVKATLVGADRVPILDSESDPILGKKYATITSLVASIFAAPSFLDSVFEVKDEADITKKLKFQLSGFTTATTRTVIWPNLSGTVALTAGAQEFTDKTLTAPIINGNSIFRKTDDGAVGVLQTSEHISTSPAADDVIYELSVKANNTTPALTTYGRFLHKILDAAAGTVDSVWELYSSVTNTLARRLSVGAGLWMEGATGGDKGAGSINAVKLYQNGAAVNGAPSAVFEDRKSQGTSGGTAANDTWTTRVLNTEVLNVGDIVDLNANQFTPTVNGWVEWTTPFFNTGRAKSRLYCVSDSASVGIGTSVMAGAGADDDTDAWSSGGCAVTAGKIYRVEYRCGGQSTSGLGLASSIDQELYTRLRFWAT